MPWKDRISVALLGFFLVVALTVELYWLLHGPHLAALADTSFIANLFRVYGDCDRAYYDALTPLSLVLEGLNVYVTQLLNLVLIYAIWKRRPYRYALQLAISSYLSYSVVLYFLTAHVADYASMRYRSGWTYFLFYGVNLPWLAGHLYLAWDAFVAVTRRFQATGS